MRTAFGHFIETQGALHEELIVLHGDVEQEMAAFRAAWPQRIFNLGTCEQTIISLAAGMACEGLRPIVYSITPFVLERPFEQIKIDLDEQNLPVMLVGYADYPTHGPTHRPLNARALCALFKHLKAFFPTTSEQAAQALLAAWHHAGPRFVSLQRAAA